MAEPRLHEQGLLRQGFLRQGFLEQRSPQHGSRPRARGPHGSDAHALRDQLVVRVAWLVVVTAVTVLLVDLV